MPRFQRQLPRLVLQLKVCVRVVLPLTVLLWGLILSKVVCNSYSTSATLHFTRAPQSPSGPLTLSKVKRSQFIRKRVQFPGTQRGNRTLAPRCWAISFSQNGPEVGVREGACPAPSQLALQAGSNNGERDKLSLEASSVL